MIRFLYKYVATPFWFVASILFAFAMGLVMFAIPVYFAVILAIATGNTIHDRAFYVWIAGGSFIGFVFVVTLLHGSNFVTLVTLRGNREVPHVKEK